MLPPRWPRLLLSLAHMRFRSNTSRLENTHQWTRYRVLMHGNPLRALRQKARQRSAPSATQALALLLKNSPDASNACKSLVLLGIIANACSRNDMVLLAL